MALGFTWNVRRAEAANIFDLLCELNVFREALPKWRRAQLDETLTLVKIFLEAARGTEVIDLAAQYRKASEEARLGTNE